MNGKNASQEAFLPFFPKFHPDHQNGTQSRHAVCHRAGIHDAIDAHDQGQNDNQGQKENDLPGEGEKDAPFRLSDGRKKVGTDGLQEIQKGKEKENAEIIDRKGVVHLRTLAENRDNLAGNELKQGEEQGGKPETPARCQEIRLLHPAVFPCAVIEADNGLQPLGNAYDECHIQLVDFRDDSHACDGHGLAVGGEGAVVFQGFRHDNLHRHHGQLVRAGGSPQGHDPPHISAMEYQMLFCQGNALAVGQQIDGHAPGNHLANDGGQGGSRHAPAKAKDEQGIQNGVDYCSRQVAQHGKSGPSVCPDQVAAPGGDDEEGEAESHTPGVGNSVGQHLVRGAEKEQQGPQENLGDDAQKGAKQPHHHQGISHVEGRMNPLFWNGLSLSHGDIERGGTADAEEQGDGDAGNRQGEADVCGGISQFPYFLSDKKLIYNIV